VSDQDFFFDEEDDAKPAAKGGSKVPAGPKAPTGAKGARAPQPAAASGGDFFAQSVSMAVTSLVAVIALLVGLIVGILIPSGGTTPQTASPAATVAPTLSEDQLNSGELPAGHPDVSGAATESATATGTGN
jgi:hypothetical protein